MISIWRARTGCSALEASSLRCAVGMAESRYPSDRECDGYVREVAELTSDDEFLRIAELPEVPVSLENGGTPVLFALSMAVLGGGLCQGGPLPGAVGFWASGHGGRGGR